MTDLLTGGRTGAQAANGRECLTSGEAPGEDRAALFEISGDLLSTLNRAGILLDVNPAWDHILGWRRDELIGRRAVDLVHPDDLDDTLALAAPGTAVPDVMSYENRYARKGGGYRWLQWNARLVGDTWYAVARDVTDRRVAEQRASKDALTGLPNRAAFTSRLELALARLDRRPGYVAVLFVDLDKFKVVNDGRGHETGDQYLRAAAVRLLDTARGVDMVARFGGDEFVVLLEDLDDPAAAEVVAQRLVDGLRRPLSIADDVFDMGASVGVALTDETSRTPEEMLHEADIAMYRAKALGGHCVQLFDDKVRTEVRRRVAAERDLREALARNEFELFYQPIVALPEMSVNRYEALLRWNHPTRGLLEPGAFLALAEETNLIVPIGEWVLREACRQAREWRLQGRHISVTVNVSTRQLDQPGFDRVVRDALVRTQLPPAALCLEITETEIMKYVGLAGPSLHALRDIGVQIAMDDFGSGYSSLGYLRSLPLDIIKIDKSFVAGIHSDRQDRAIVEAIVKLGRDTDRSVIIEGVETEALHEALVGIGGDLAQGFFYDRPKPVSALSLDG